MTDQPSLPYGGTEGHSGTETSRALAEDTVESAASRQDAVLAYIRERGAHGATVGEVRDNLMPHHGAASRSLTNLHIAGRLARLTEVRDRAKVYVHPSYVAGRETERYQATSQRHRRAALEEARRRIVALDWREGDWSDGVNAALWEIDDLISEGL